MQASGGKPRERPGHSSAHHYKFILNLTVITIIATMALIALGGTVRATGSGLACSDWPLCEGQALPPAKRGATIEFAHRLAATAVGSLALGIGLYSFRIRREAPQIFYVALLAGLLVLLQILLGAAVIFTKLPALLVTAHLGLATMFVATLVVIAIQAFFFRDGIPTLRSSTSTKTLQATLLAGTLTYGMLLLGAYVGSSGSSLACANWPLCNNTLLPIGSDWRSWIGFAHRLLALAMMFSVSWAAWTAFAPHTPRFVRSFLLGATGLTLLEIFIGALNPILKVPAAVAVTHLIVATMIWMLIIGALTICMQKHVSQVQEAPQ